MLFESSEPHLECLTLCYLQAQQSGPIFGESSFNDMERYSQKDIGRAMNRDEKRYGPDSHEFNPDRFFDEHGNLNDDDRVLAYGFGRRCEIYFVTTPFIDIV